MTFPLPCLRAVSLILFLLSSGCAAQGVLRSGDAEGDLRARVLQYWDARKDGDLGAAYSFYSSEFKSRNAKVDFLKNYRRLARFIPEKVEIEHLSLDEGGKTAKVKVLVTIQQEIEGFPLEVTGPSEEDWVREDGRWWKLDEPFVLNI